MSYESHAVLVALVGVILGFGSADSAHEGCVFKVTNHTTENNQPVPLFNQSSDYELAIPHHGLIHLRPGQNISLLCFGNRNYVRQTNSNITTVTCLRGDKVQLYKHSHKFEEVQCRHSVRGNVRATDKECGRESGRIYQIGYPVSRTEWITLISTCYVPAEGRTLYTRHTLYGEEIKYASKAKYRPAWSPSGQYENITASIAYQQVYQKGTLSRILGSSILANNFINNNSFFAKGHLSPHADFILASAQFSTYFYINAAPQWQKINGANWKSIESTVRNLGKFYGTLEIITGTHGILALFDKQNNPHDIYLGQRNTLPVPKYLWKIVLNKATQEAIVFIILNNPFIEAVNDEVFCENICEQVGFDKTSWKDPSSGLVFCCTIAEFQKVVKTAPKLDVSGVLVQQSLLWEPSLLNVV
ncbi:hypothetical protein HUJ04_006563 [Dendroctonus ponderosae]|uniref:DNA/RNA non-specific endonuclease/pyrophosphatase/phosphodiesterase domain-containing protein n=1 Tax=Dendroctonus ponderosae TaxID=77166 RepID=A0AAR5PR83_DENPD|nr:hypothetical protein HUJ04_006563 [Dendroctonus ponderosae]